MLEALAVDLDTAPAVAVVVDDTAAVSADVKVNLGVDLGLGDLLPDDFDLVDVGNLVNVERVF